MRLIELDIASSSYKALPYLALAGGGGLASTKGTNVVDPELGAGSVTGVIGSKIRDP